MKNLIELIESKSYTFADIRKDDDTTFLDIAIDEDFSKVYEIKYTCYVDVLNECGGDYDTPAYSETETYFSIDKVFLVDQCEDKRTKIDFDDELKEAIWKAFEDLIINS